MRLAALPGFPSPDSDSLEIFRFECRALARWRYGAGTGTALRNGRRNLAAALLHGITAEIPESSIGDGSMSRLTGSLKNLTCSGSRSPSRRQSSVPAFMRYSRYLNPDERPLPTSLEHSVYICLATPEALL